LKTEKRKNIDYFTVVSDMVMFLNEIETKHVSQNEVWSSEIYIYEG